VAAVVNGQKIPTAQFKDFLASTIAQAAQSTTAMTPKQAGDKAIAQLIVTAVAIQLADKHRVPPTKKQIDVLYATFVAGSGGQAGFNTTLARLGFTPADVRLLAESNVAQKNLAPVIVPLRKSGPIATGRHILIAARTRATGSRIARLLTSPPTTVTTDRCTHKVLTDAEAKKEAQKLIDQIQNHAASFARLARKCSDDPGSAVHGGKLLGVTNTSKNYPFAEGYVSPFETALFGGPVGKLQLIHSEFGWHIVQVTSRRKGKYPNTTVQTGTTLRSAIQQSHFQAWLMNAVEASRVTILEHVS
jgi:hypothetical protein